MIPDGLVASFLCGLLVSAGLGSPLIALLRRVGARQTVSVDAPARHAGKQGTPTMGGLMILAGLAAPVLADVALRPERRSALSLLSMTMAFGLIGFVDDYLIATRGKNLGLRARSKFGMQVVAASGFVLYLSQTAVAGRTTVLGGVDLGVWYYVLAGLFIVGFSNAVNFSDGLDGLAGGMTVILALSVSLIVFAGAGFGWLPVFGGALAGACGGFLVYNRHPARVFMGDTGSLALGAALAGMALMGKAELLFQVGAVAVWAELFSVIVQVTVFKYRRRRYGLEAARARRVFRRTPLHHHFEELGWPETRIVALFCGVTAAASAVAVILSILSRS
jgi:phospho-N-acetylmuramoyl-pentapeptide-transferase